MQPSTRGPPTRRLPPCCQFHGTPTSPHPPPMTEGRGRPRSIRTPGGSRALLQTQPSSRATFLSGGTRGRESVGRAPLDGRPRPHPGHTPPLVCYRRDEPHLQAPDGATVRVPADAFLPELGRDRLRVMAAGPDGANWRRVRPSTSVPTRYRFLRLCHGATSLAGGLEPPTLLRAQAPQAGASARSATSASGATGRPTSRPAGLGPICYCGIHMVRVYI